MFPRASMRVAVLPPPGQVATSYPRRRHRWRHVDITTVTAATPPSRRRRPYLPPPTSAPPSASRLPAPPAPCPGLNPGRGQSLVDSGEMAGGVWTKRKGLWWTSSVKHPRWWKAFSWYLHLRPSTRQLCNLEELCGCESGLGWKIQPCVPRTFQYILQCYINLVFLAVLVR